MVPSLSVTSTPPSLIAVTVTVTTSPFLWVAAVAAKLSGVSCLMPREMRSFSTSTSSTFTFTTSPFL